MGWLVRERRGVSWKEQTLESLAAPPLPLVVFVGLFLVVLYFATYSEIQEKMERSKVGFRFGLLLLPVVGIAVVNVIVLHRRWWWFYATRVPAPASASASASGEGGSPWGLLLVVALLLVMVHYHSSFQSWFRSF